MIMLSWPFAI
jgi:hypothetical protein